MLLVMASLTNTCASKNIYLILNGLFETSEYSW